MNRGSNPITQLIGDSPDTFNDRTRLTKAATTIVLSLLSATALLALAGWFIASSAVAGLAVASTFSFLFPSAGVQALAWARTLARYGERITTHRATLELAATPRTNLFSRAQHLNRDQVAELRSSDLLTRIMSDSDAVENLLLRSSFPLLAAAAVITAVAFAIVSVTMAAVAVAGMVITTGSVVLLGRRQSRGPTQGLVAARASARRTLIESLEGLPELKSFGAERQAADAIIAELRRLTRNRRRLGHLTALGQSVGMLLADLTVLAVLALAAGLIAGHRLSAPMFVAAGLVAIAVFEPNVGLSAAIPARARARAAAARLTSLLPELATPQGAASSLPGSPLPVDVRLGDGDRTLTVCSGNTVLITGASGTGKSTILRAITGPPAPGLDVRIAGTSAASIDPVHLTEQIALVAQDAYVFDGTIRENLQLANPAADEAALWQALTAAALDDTVAAFPAGLDTQVGPAGAKLSGGQRRRLSVAQGLLRRPRLLLLDEPTEGLDAPTATRLLKGARDYDRSMGLAIVLHDRQALTLPFTPTARLHLTKPVPTAKADGRRTGYTRGLR